LASLLEDLNLVLYPSCDGAVPADVIHQYIIVNTSCKIKPVLDELRICIICTVQVKREIVKVKPMAKSLSERFFILLP
jgi:hypothetical protein